MKKLRFYCMGLFCFFISITNAVSEPVGEIKTTLTNLDKAKFAAVRKEWVHDYGFSRLSGMLNTFEHLRSLKSFAALNKMFSMDIYLKGPHTRSELNLSDKYSFGHYNPEFVKDFHRVLKFILSDKTFISATHEKMKKYGLIHKLQRLQHVYRYIESHNSEFKTFKNKYAQQLANKTWQEGSYSGHMPPFFNNSKYWNWSESVYHFWIRRSIDGTMVLWANIIDDILDNYSEDALSPEFTNNM